MSNKNEIKESRSTEITKTPNEKPKKKVFFIGTILLALVIAAVAFFFIGNSTNSPEKSITAFQEAVRNQEVEELQHLLTSADDDFEINADNTLDLITYLNSNAEVLGNLENKFRGQAETGDAPSTAYASIDLVTDGKRMLFFDDYRFEVTPGYIHLMANADSVDFYINAEPAEDVAPYTENGFGPLMPGLYQVEAVFGHSVLTLEDTGEIDLYETNIEEVVYSFDFPVEEITAHSTHDDYLLYVNGEQTDIVIQDGEQNIGEFPNDETVTLHIGKDFPWGEVVSEEAVVTNENEVEFIVTHALSEEVRTELMERMNTIVANYQEALSAKDASLLRDGVTDELIESLENQIADIQEDNPDYTGSLVAATYHGDNISNPEFDENLDAYVVTMQVQHVFHEPNGNIGWMFRDEDANEYTRSRELTVLFNEESGEWDLHQNENHYFIIPSSDQIEFEL